MTEETDVGVAIPRLSGNDRRRAADHPHASLLDAVTVSRFWRLVDRGSLNECWPWKGDTDRAGYGVFTLNGRRRPAHELALSFTTGEIRHPDLVTCHSCDNPPCCNPNHLRFDTQIANARDAIARRRNAHGSRSPHTNLTEADVLVIRERRALGARHKDLAIDFGITIAAVTAIVHGTNWKHVGGPLTNRNKKGA